MKKLLLFFTALLLLCIDASAQAKVLKPLDLVIQSKNELAQTQSTSLFSVRMATSRDRAQVDDFVEDFSLLNLDRNGINGILNQAPEIMNLTIPSNYRSGMELELVKVNIFAEDFTFKTSSGHVITNNLGVHYRGIVKGDKESLVTISIYDDEVAGLISTQKKNFVLGKMKDSDSHIIYDDKNVMETFRSDCGMQDDDPGYDPSMLRRAKTDRATGDCIKWYFEVDYNVFQAQGGLAQTQNWVSSLINQSATIYANENLNTTLSSVFIWTEPSPYAGANSSSTYLGRFQNRIGTRADIGNADLGHLITQNNIGGVAAGFSGLCNSNVDNSLCISGMSGSGNIPTVPTYSFNVFIVCHEFGHLYGSRHTHACVWNGNNTAIDGCSGSTEGSCPLPGNPSSGGTIMSYCANQSVGIDFNQGFGPQPGNVIRNSVANATCTTVCADPTCDDGVQNGDETGIDCGGPDCPACPTCDDGIQNGDETGVDCGGSDCAPCPCFDNGVTLTINLDNYPGETSWRITSGATILASGGTYGGQPTGSTVVEVACLTDGCYDFTILDSYGDGICCSFGSGSYQLVDDSNGAVLASGGSFGLSETTNFCVGGGTGPTCNDGIQNGNETGVDCGGPDCPPCTTCDDGIQNGQETGVDCGGPDCPACPTCDDGIQNGDETGVDCGGPDCPPCNTGECTYELINFEDFNSGFGIWNDGGSDCRRSSRDGAYAVSGSPVRLRDNTSTSVVTTDNLNLSSYEEITVDFSYYARSMENNEDFWLQISTNGGSSYTTVATWARGSDFNNDQRYFENVVVAGPFSSNTRVRFRCDASGNNDYVYLDDIELTGCNTGSASFVPSRENLTNSVEVFPNPVFDVLNIKYFLKEGSSGNISVTDLSGKVLRTQPANPGSQHNIRMDLQHLAEGIYFVHLRTNEEIITKKIVVMN